LHINAPADYWAQKVLAASSANAEMQDYVRKHALQLYPLMFHLMAQKHNHRRVYCRCRQRMSKENQESLVEQPAST
jgi:hypothetical protein